MPQTWLNTARINNNGPMLSGNNALDIEYLGQSAHCTDMKNIVLRAAILVLLSSPLHAACYADYKAKKDNPLQLHYGVAELPSNACNSASAAAKAIAPRLARAGWTLLNIVSVFGENELGGRKASAGQYFLRF